MNWNRSKTRSLILSAVSTAFAASVLTTASALAQHLYMPTAARIPSAESMLFGWRALSAQHQDDAPTAEEYLIDQLVN